MPSVDFMTFQAEDAIAVTVSAIWNIIIFNNKYYVLHHP